MSKPRIVYECKHGIHYTKIHKCDQDSALLLYWPSECPYTPEQVMAACERADYDLAGVPFQRGLIGQWRIPVFDLRIMQRRFDDLTPEFMAEPKKCEHKRRGEFGIICLDCHATLTEQRKGERRKGERRAANRRVCGKYGGRRKYDLTVPSRSHEFDRRSGKDRRGQP